MRKTQNDNVGCVHVEFWFSTEFRASARSFQKRQSSLGTRASSEYKASSSSFRAVPLPRSLSLSSRSAADFPRSPRSLKFSPISPIEFCTFCAMPQIKGNYVAELRLNRCEMESLHLRSARFARNESRSGSFLRSAANSMRCDGRCILRVSRTETEMSETIVCLRGAGHAHRGRSALRMFPRRSTGSRLSGGWRRNEAANRTVATDVIARQQKRTLSLFILDILLIRLHAQTCQTWNLLDSNV